MSTHRISKKGSVVIPDELRRKYHLTPGTEVITVDCGGVLSILPTRSDPVDAGRGRLKDLPGLLADVIEEHNRERNRDGSCEPAASS